MIDRQREIVLPEGSAQAELRRRSRRGFLIGGVAAAIGTGGYLWMKSDEDEDGIPNLERRVLGLNGRLSHAYLSNSHLMPTYGMGEVRPLKVNGNVGLDSPVEAGWRLNVNTGHGPALKLSVADIQALPKVEMVTRFCCIEGWSTVVHWAGARFSDFTRKYMPPGVSLPPYVNMTTPDEEYYVGLDTKSAMHPQTLLAYEYNGTRLAPEHGAPLRLVIPVKYGVKNLKRIGTIQYTSKKPADYWADNGYDWFAGL